MSLINEQAGSQTCTFWNKATGTNTYLHEYVYGPNRTVVGSIITNGSSTSYNSSSDGRLKKIIDGDLNGLDIINKLKIKHFKWIVSEKDDVGLIAQEVKEVFPNAGSGSEETQYMIDNSKFVIPLIKAIQEQQSIIINLTQRIELLEQLPTPKTTANKT